MIAKARLAAAALALSLAGLCFAACGARSTLEEGTAFAPDAGVPDAVRPPPDVEPPPPDVDPPPPDVLPPPDVVVCKQDGDTCTDASECCTATCNAGHCGKLCIPDGQPCMPGADCCAMACGESGVCGGCVLDGQGCMLAGACCSQICDQGSCGGTDCPHDICKVGVKLSASCGPCVAKICQADVFCCMSMWDQLCVFEVGSVCGQLCPTP